MTGLADGFRRNLPNALTIARVVLAIAFFAVLAPWRYQDSPLARGESPDWWLLGAAAIFVIAAATDALDGHLARKWNVVSAFGRIMDPFADKVLVIGAFLMLAGPGFTAVWETHLMVPGTDQLHDTGTLVVSVSFVQPWMVVLILARELLVTSIRGVLEGQGVAFPACWSGKLKMILQSICVPAVLVLMNVLPANDGTTTDWAGRASQILVWATIIVTAWSGVPYVLRASESLRRSRPIGETP